MKLNITERLYLMNLAPTTWDIPLYKLRKAMLDKLGLTEDEEKTIQYKRSGDKYTENGQELIVPQGEIRYIPLPIITDIDFTEWETEYFKKELKRLEGDKKLNDVTTELYFKFVEGKDAEG